MYFERDFSEPRTLSYVKNTNAMVMGLFVKTGYIVITTYIHRLRMFESDYCRPTASEAEE